MQKQLEAEAHYNLSVKKRIFKLWRDSFFKRNEPHPFPSGVAVYAGFKWISKTLGEEIVKLNIYSVPSFNLDPNTEEDRYEISSIQNISSSNSTDLTRKLASDIVSDYSNNYSSLQNITQGKKITKFSLSRIRDYASSNLKISKKYFLLHLHALAQLDCYTLLKCFSSWKKIMEFAKALDTFYVRNRARKELKLWKKWMLRQKRIRNCYMVILEKKNINTMYRILFVWHLTFKSFLFLKMKTNRKLAHKVFAKFKQILNIKSNLKLLSLRSDRIYRYKLLSKSLLKWILHLCPLSKAKNAMASELLHEGMVEFIRENSLSRPSDRKEELKNISRSNLYYTLTSRGSNTNQNQFSLSSSTAPPANSHNLSPTKKTESNNSLSTILKVIQVIRSNLKSRRSQISLESISYQYYKLKSIARSIKYWRKRIMQKRLDKYNDEIPGISQPPSYAPRIKNPYASKTLTSSYSQPSIPFSPEKSIYPENNEDFPTFSPPNYNKSFKTTHQTPTDLKRSQNYPTIPQDLSPIYPVPPTSHKINPPLPPTPSSPSPSKYLTSSASPTSPYSPIKFPNLIHRYNLRYYMNRWFQRTHRKLKLKLKYNIINQKSIANQLTNIFGMWIILSSKQKILKRVSNRVYCNTIKKQLTYAFFAWKNQYERLVLIRTNQKNLLKLKINEIKLYGNLIRKNNENATKKNILRTWSLFLNQQKKGKALYSKILNIQCKINLRKYFNKWKIWNSLYIIAIVIQKTWRGYAVRELKCKNLVQYLNKFRNMYDKIHKFHYYITIKSYYKKLVNYLKYKNNLYSLELRLFYGKKLIKNLKNLRRKKSKSIENLRKIYINYFIRKIKKNFFSRLLNKIRIFNLEYNMDRMNKIKIYSNFISNLKNLVHYKKINYNNKITIKKYFFNKFINKLFNIIKYNKISESNFQKVKKILLKKYFKKFFYIKIILNKKIQQKINLSKKMKFLHNFNKFKVKVQKSLFRKKLADRFYKFHRLRYAFLRLFSYKLTWSNFSYKLLAATKSNYDDLKDDKKKNMIIKMLSSTFAAVSSSSVSESNSSSTSNLLFPYLKSFSSSSSLNFISSTSSLFPHVMSSTSTSLIEDPYKNPNYYIKKLINFYNTKKFAYRFAVIQLRKSLRKLKHNIFKNQKSQIMYKKVKKFYQKKVFRSFFLLLTKLLGKKRIKNRLANKENFSAIYYRNNLENLPKMYSSLKIPTNKLDLYNKIKKKVTNAKLMFYVNERKKYLKSFVMKTHQLGSIYNDEDENFTSTSSILYPKATSNSYQIHYYYNKWFTYSTSRFQEKKLIKTIYKNYFLDYYMKKQFLKWYNFAKKSSKNRKNLNKLDFLAKKKYILSFFSIIINRYRKKKIIHYILKKYFSNNENKNFYLLYYKKKLRLRNTLSSSSSYDSNASFLLKDFKDLDYDPNIFPSSFSSSSSSKSTSNSSSLITLTKYLKYKNYYNLVLYLSFRKLIKILLLNPLRRIRKASIKQLYIKKLLKKASHFIEKLKLKVYYNKYYKPNRLSYHKLHDYYKLNFKKFINNIRKKILLKDIKKIVMKFAYETRMKISLKRWIRYTIAKQKFKKILKKFYTKNSFSLWFKHFKKCNQLSRFRLKVQKVNELRLKRTTLSLWYMFQKIHSNLRQKFEIVNRRYILWQKLKILQAWIITMDSKLLTQNYRIVEEKNKKNIQRRFLMAWHLKYFQHSVLNQKNLKNSFSNWKYLCFSKNYQDSCINKAEKFHLLYSLKIKFFKKFKNILRTKRIYKQKEYLNILYILKKKLFYSFLIWKDSSLNFIPGDQNTISSLAANISSDAAASFAGLNPPRRSATPLASLDFNKENYNTLNISKNKNSNLKKSRKISSPYSFPSDNETSYFSDDHQYFGKKIPTSTSRNRYNNYSSVSFDNTLGSRGKPLVEKNYFNSTYNTLFRSSTSTPSVPHGLLRCFNKLLKYARYRKYRRNYRKLYQIVSSWRNYTKKIALLRIAFYNRLKLIHNKELLKRGWELLQLSQKMNTKASLINQKYNQKLQLIQFSQWIAHFEKHNNTRKIIDTMITNLYKMSLKRYFITWRIKVKYFYKLYAINIRKKLFRKWKMTAISFRFRKYHLLNKSLSLWKQLLFFKKGKLAVLLSRRMMMWRICTKLISHQYKRLMVAFIKWKTGNENLKVFRYLAYFNTDISLSKWEHDPSTSSAPGPNILTASKTEAEGVKILRELAQSQSASILLFNDYGSNTRHDETVWTQEEIDNVNEVSSTKVPRSIKVISHFHNKCHQFLEKHQEEQKELELQKSKLLLRSNSHAFLKNLDPKQEKLLRQSLRKSKDTLKVEKELNDFSKFILSSSTKTEIDETQSHSLRRKMLLFTSPSRESLTKFIGLRPSISKKKEFDEDFESDTNNMPPHLKKSVSFYGNSSPQREREKKSSIPTSSFYNSTRSIHLDELN